jgi:hypothetical protein
MTGTRELKKFHPHIPQRNCSRIKPIFQNSYKNWNQRFSLKNENHPTLIHPGLRLCYTLQGIVYIVILVMMSDG